MSTPPLVGIVVVSLEQAVAAPFATRQLADLGVRVIKVERPDGGDFARAYDESVHGQSSYFVWLNRSKESIALDLKSPAGRPREVRGGRWRLPGGVMDALVPPVDIAGVEPVVGPVPALGEHTAAILRELGHTVDRDLQGSKP